MLSLLALGLLLRREGNSLNALAVRRWLLIVLASTVDHRSRILAVVRRGSDHSGCLYAIRPGRPWWMQALVVQLALGGPVACFDIFDLPVSLAHHWSISPGAVVRLCRGPHQPCRRPGCRHQCRHSGLDAPPPRRCCSTPCMTRWSGLSLSPWPRLEAPHDRSSFVDHCTGGGPVAVPARGTLCGSPALVGRAVAASPTGDGTGFPSAPARCRPGTEHGGPDPHHTLIFDSGPEFSSDFHGTGGRGPVPRRQGRRRVTAWC